MTIYLEPKDVPTTLRRAYAGKKFAAEVCEEVRIPTDAGLWSGGSRDFYSAISLTTGQAIPLPGQDTAPWGNRQTQMVKLAPDFAIVRHTIFCGKDLGLTFYLHPVNAASLLPKPADLTDDELKILSATRRFKASYAGRDRYEMAKEEARYSPNAQAFPTRKQWEEVKASLADHGFLTRAGAITTKGRNAIGDAGPQH